MKRPAAAGKDKAAKAASKGNELVSVSDGSEDIPKAQTFHGSEDDEKKEKDNGDDVASRDSEEEDGKEDEPADVPELEDKSEAAAVEDERTSKTKGRKQNAANVHEPAAGEEGEATSRKKGRKEKAAEVPEPAARKEGEASSKKKARKNKAAEVPEPEADKEGEATSRKKGRRKKDEDESEAAAVEDEGTSKKKKGKKDVEVIDDGLSSTSTSDKKKKKKKQKKAPAGEPSAPAENPSAKAKAKSKIKGLELQSLETLTWGNDLKASQDDGTEESGLYTEEEEEKEAEEAVATGSESGTAAAGTPASTTREKRDESKAKYFHKMLKEDKIPDDILDQWNHDTSRAARTKLINKHVLLEAGCFRIVNSRSFVEKKITQATEKSKEGTEGLPLNLFIAQKCGNDNRRFAQSLAMKEIIVIKKNGMYWAYHNTESMATSSSKSKQQQLEEARPQLTADEAQVMENQWSDLQVSTKPAQNQVDLTELGQILGIKATPSLTDVNATEGALRFDVPGLATHQPLKDLNSFTGAKVKLEQFGSVGSTKDEDDDSKSIVSLSSARMLTEEYFQKRAVPATWIAFIMYLSHV